MPYRYQKAVVFSVVLGYAVLGFALQPFGRGDTYPLFSWQLFSWIPNPEVQYTIEITRVGGEVYDPPLEFRETKFLFDAVGQSPTEYTPLITRLGALVAEGETPSEASALLRERIRNAFPPGAYEYTLYQVTVDQIEYFKTGEVQARKKLEKIEGVVK